ncbi:MAG TPA: hypothetical protein VGB54_05720 [Allosphingosinicella sp.]
MRILLLAASIAALGLSVPAVAGLDDQKGGGRGHDRGGEGRGRGNDDRGGHQGRGNDDRREARGRGNEGRGREARQAERGRDRAIERRAEGRGRGNDGRGRGVEDRGRDRQQRQVERTERRQERQSQRAERRDERQIQRVAGPPERQQARRADRRAVQVTDRAQIARLRWEPAAGLVRGCPPGLARKHNGCMPPGQVRQQAQNWYSSLWPYQDARSFIYEDGYLYRLDQGGTIGSYIPLIGGALWPGNSWPEQFAAAPVADYHVDYFGLDDGLDYRFADGAIYGVDPTSQLIQQVAALVTGDDWTVGQQMPDGYGVYNLPHEYRDQYPDTDEALYRYSDGYVYQVDPTTQLIQAAIQLIT